MQDKNSPTAVATLASLNLGCALNGRCHGLQGQNGDRRWKITDQGAFCADRWIRYADEVLLHTYRIQVAWDSQADCVLQFPPFLSLGCPT